MKRLHANKLKDHSTFTGINEWLKPILNFNNTGLPIQAIINAKEILLELIESQNESVLLHGDLHHGNILSSQHDEWLAIDPKGVVGEVAYEVGAFIRNPIELLTQLKSPQEIMQQRLTLFADLLDLDKDRIKKWSYVQAILAACWAIEDGDSPDKWIQVAEILYQ